MKLNSIKLIAIVTLITLLSVIFGACAKKSENSSEIPVGGNAFGKAEYTADMAAPAAGQASITSTTVAKDKRGNGVISPIEPTSGFVPDVTEKLIYTGYLNVQTKEFEKTLEAAKNLTKKLGGFVESSSTSGDTYYPEGSAKAMLRGRNASITYRIPQKSFDSFFASLGELGNVVDSSMNVQNITAQFVDNEAHLDSLQIQQERLLALLKKADKVEDMISIEKSLADVRYGIESITSTLRNWQTQVDYSTISMNISEVSDYSENVPAVRSFWQRIGDAVKESAKNFLRGVQNVIINVILVLPTFLIWAIIIFAVIISVRKVYSRKRAGKGKQEPIVQEKKENN